MKTTRRSLRGGPSAGYLVAGALLLGFSACAYGQKPAPDPVTPAAPAVIISPADASAAQKQADFRLNPPRVEEMLVKKLAWLAAEGGSLLVVKFAPDKRIQRQVVLHPDEAPIVLRDDGLKGDEQAGDSLFSAVVPVDFETVAAQQAADIAKLPTGQAPVTVPRFDGRVKVADEQVDVSALAELRRQGIVRLITLPTGDIVDEHRSLLITATSVVEDPGRTFNCCSRTGTPMGPWTFGYLMQQMANTPVTGIDPADFTEHWLRHWLVDQNVNEFSVPARRFISVVFSSWPRRADGRLDLARAPFKLLAIVNRIDLASNLAYGAGSSGEARFVFGFMGGGCTPLPFTVILEYGIPRHTCAELHDWAQQWLDLGSLALGSPAYNAALQAITDQFTRSNAAPEQPNGSALNQVRTNEVALGPLPWELREFRIFSTDSDAGQLRQVTVKQTPDMSFNGADLGSGPGAHAPDLGAWINANAAAVSNDQHTVPAEYFFPPLRPFLGGVTPNPSPPVSQAYWNAPLIAADARFHFSLNTCNGCHGRETDTTAFTHINVARFGEEARLSRFLTGNGDGTAFRVGEPLAPFTEHSFFDLQRRAQVLYDFAHQDCTLSFAFVPILMTD